MRTHAHVVGSQVDVVLLGDQMAIVTRFSCGFSTAMAGNEVGNEGIRTNALISYM